MNNIYSKLWCRFSVFLSKERTQFTISSSVRYRRSLIDTMQKRFWYFELRTRQNSVESRIKPIYPFSHTYIDQRLSYQTYFHSDFHLSSFHYKCSEFGYSQLTSTNHCSNSDQCKLERKNMVAFKVEQNRFSK